MYKTLGMETGKLNENCQNPETKLNSSNTTDPLLFSLLGQKKEEETLNEHGLHRF